MIKTWNLLKFSIACLNNPDKAQSKMEERLRKKRNKILQTKTGSGSPMKVTFNKFDYSNSYIWFEFCNPPLQKDVCLICDVIRFWHIIGCLGGCNSLNVQVNFFLHFIGRLGGWNPACISAKPTKRISFSIILS
ncbi:hypothetical protein BVRB_4g084780 [Beta vulgaris subsp. vulgaris]|nr:hypothetical protein BVRB_4g084780 [Beta vulgaris subsp. vulgaris]